MFLTASATLREQVSSSFRKLQTAAVGAAEARRLGEISASADLHTLKDVSAEAFPLFLSTRRWLHLLDGTVGGRAFFERCGCCAHLLLAVLPVATEPGGLGANFE